jgi:hypothetical protein
MMREISPDPELARLLADFGRRGGVLDFVFLQSEKEMPPPEPHRAAALAGMAAIDRRLETYAEATTSTQYPIEIFYRVTWDAARLTGEQIPFETFWGSDDATPTQTSQTSWTIPNVDGYKTAFFLPPYPLRGSEQEHQQLFASINAFLLGPNPNACEIFSWGTDWSNYFDAGKEWWGAFFWTLREPDADVFTVIGASSTD